MIGCYGSARLRANLEEMDGLQVCAIEESLLIWGHIVGLGISVGLHVVLDSA